MKKIVYGIDNNDMFYLYSREREIVEIILKKLNNYGASSKERIQKENEFFHLMCYLELSPKSELIDSITPHEPGDFLFQNKEKKEIIEVVECFGNSENYIEIKNRLNCVFKRTINKQNEGSNKFLLKHLINNFKKLLNKKIKTKNI